MHEVDRLNSHCNADGSTDIIYITTHGPYLTPTEIDMEEDLAPGYAIYNEVWVELERNNIKGKPERFKAVIFRLSEPRSRYIDDDTLYDEKLCQWETYRYICPRTEQCCCSQKLPVNVYFVKNKFNGNSIIVGSCCIEKFGNLQLREECKAITGERYKCRHCGEYCIGSMKRRLGKCVYCPSCYESIEKKRLEEERLEKERSDASLALALERAKNEREKREEEERKREVANRERLENERLERERSNKVAERYRVEREAKEIADKLRMRAIYQGGGWKIQEDAIQNHKKVEKEKKEAIKRLPICDDAQIAIEEVKALERHNKIDALEKIAMEKCIGAMVEKERRQLLEAKNTKWEIIDMTKREY